MSITFNPISSDAVTKKGHHYKKTHVAKNLGLLAGAAFSVMNYKAAKKVFNDPVILADLKAKLIVPMRKLIAAGYSKEYAHKLINVSVKSGAIGAVVAPLFIGLAVGAGINKIINHARANKADKAAM